MEKYFKLFANCIVTKGYNHSLLSDLQREKSEILPNDMTQVIEILNTNNPISSLKNKYGFDDLIIIDEYIKYLIKNDYGFYCDKFDIKYLVELNKEFIIPCHITNALIEIDSESSLKRLFRIFNQLESLGCKNITLFFYFDIDKAKLFDSIELLNDFRVESYDIFLKYDKNISLDIIDLFKRTVNKLKSVVFYNSPKRKQIEYNKNQLFDLLFLDENISNFKKCGIVDIKYFNTNMPKVLESINHNSCLNKKVTIDKDGNIKNCPSMPQSFGNIKHTSLEEALNHPDFKKYWNINKDQIEVCKDCEFRHICTDCRAYIEDPQNIYSKPLKCGYNPYTNEWSEWSTNPLKQKAIEYYGMQDLIKKDV